MEPDHGRVILVCVSGGSWDDPEHEGFVRELRRELWRQAFASEVFSLDEFRKLVSSGAAIASGAFVRIILGEVTPYSVHASGRSLSPRDLKEGKPDLIGIVLDDPNTVFERISIAGIDVTPGSAHEWMRVALRELEQFAGTATVRIRPVTLAQPVELANLITESEEPRNLIPASWSLALPIGTKQERKGPAQSSLFPPDSKLPVAARAPAPAASSVPVISITAVDPEAQGVLVRSAICSAFGLRLNEIPNRHVEMEVRFLLERNRPVELFAMEFAARYLARVDIKGPLTDREAEALLKSCEEGRADAYPSW